MDTREKVILEIVVGILVGVVVFSSTTTQGNGLSFGVLYGIASGLITILTLYCVFFGYPAIHKKILTWENTPNPKNITLGKNPLSSSCRETRLGSVRG